MPIGLLATTRARLEIGETAEADATDPTLLRLTLPMRMRLRGGRSWSLGSTRPAARRDPVLIKGLRAAHAMLGTDAPILPNLVAAPASPYRRRLVRRTFLAPEIQRGILAGRQLPGLTLERLMHASLPIFWSEQAIMLDSLGVSGVPPPTAG